VHPSNMPAIPRKVQTPKPRRTGNGHPRIYVYHQFSLDEEFIREWPTLESIDNADIEGATCKIRNQNVSSCCNKVRNTHGGFKWRKVKIDRSTAAS